MTDYLTTGFFTNRATKTHHQPGERVTMTQKDAQGYLDRNHIVKVRTATKSPPETREKKGE